MTTQNNEAVDIYTVGGATYTETATGTVVVTLNTSDWSGVYSELDHEEYREGYDFRLTPPAMNTESAIEIRFSINDDTVALWYCFEMPSEERISIYYRLSDANNQVQSLQGLWVNTQTGQTTCQKFNPDDTDDWIFLMEKNSEAVGETIYWYYNIETGQWEWGIDQTESAAAPGPNYDTFVMRGQLKDTPSSALGKLEIVAHDTVTDTMELEGFEREEAFDLPDC